MKRFVIALVTALIIAAIGFAPVAAAAPAAEMANTACGDTYIVQPLDYLAKIASYCGTTVASILANNPGIVNPNIIYPGQVLKLTGGGTPPPTPTPIPVTASTYVVQYGDTLFKISLRYGTTVAAIMAVNPQIYSASWIYAGQVINLPTGSYVPPTTPTYPIPPTYPTSGGQVTLSTYRASAGGNITVYVTGFPAGADIDYRVGKNGAGYSVAYDAVTDSNGSDDKVITLPAGANEGEYWVVRVVTTGMKNGVDRYSALIYIDN